MMKSIFTNFLQESISIDPYSIMSGEGKVGALNEKKNPESKILPRIDSKETERSSKMMNTEAPFTERNKH